MGPFDFLGSIKQGLEQYFQPSRNQVGGGSLSEFFPSRTMNFRLDKSPQVPDINPLVHKAEAPAPTQMSAPPQQVAPEQPQPQQLDSLLPLIEQLLNSGQQQPNLLNSQGFIGDILRAPAVPEMPQMMDQIRMKYRNLRGLFP